jgi:hypothetical protein
LVIGRMPSVYRVSMVSALHRRLNWENACVSPLQSCVTWFDNYLLGIVGGVKFHC